MSGASLPSWARKGAKVVVIDASPTATGNRMPFACGEIVTVAGVKADGTLTLAEYDRPLPGGVRTISPYGYKSSRFRPLVSTKTEAEDVAMFHNIARQKLPEVV